MTSYISIKVHITRFVHFSQTMDETEGDNQSFDMSANFPPRGAPQAKHEEKSGNFQGNKSHSAFPSLKPSAGDDQVPPGFEPVGDVPPPGVDVHIASRPPPSSMNQRNDFPDEEHGSRGHQDGNNNNNPHARERRSFDRRGGPRPNWRGGHQSRGGFNNRDFRRGMPPNRNYRGPPPRGYRGPPPGMFGDPRFGGPAPWDNHVS